MLRGLSAQLVGGLLDEGDADCTDYADFEICLHGGFWLMGEGMRGEGRGVRG